MIPDILTAHDKDGDPIRVVFRQLHAPVPAGWKAGLHWLVEAYEGDDDSPLHPVGLCWVMGPTENLSPERRHEAYLPASIDHMLVTDEWRRRGIAALLVDACRRRWPRLVSGAPDTADGTAFLTAYLARARAEGPDGVAFADGFR